MRKWGNTFIIWALILIIGPFFGITLRGFGDTYYGVGFLAGLGFLALGIILKQCANTAEINKMKKEYENSYSYNISNKYNSNVNYNENEKSNYEESLEEDNTTLDYEINYYLPNRK